MTKIQAGCVYSKANLMELQTELHQKTRRNCLWLSLLGVAMVAVGVWQNAGSMIFFGVFWTIFFLIFRNHPARRAVRQIRRHNKKAYGCDVRTDLTFYASWVTAKNVQTEKERRVRYDEVSRVIQTEHLYALILADRVALLVDRRELDEEQEIELVSLLREKCRPEPDSPEIASEEPGES